MEYIQQNINFQKTKLLNLINNLINCQLINQEIFINSEIKRENELLASLLIEKQKYCMNQMAINNINNIDSPINFNPNLIMNNPPQININPFQIPSAQIKDINKNNIINQNNIINVKFEQKSTGKTYVIVCNANDRICDVIELYKKKSNDYNDNHFLYNNERLNNLTSTLKEKKFMAQGTITVVRIGNLKGATY